MKKKSLADLYKSVRSNKDLWCYYELKNGTDNYPSDLFIGDKCEYFIKEYFKNGGKYSLLDGFNDLEKMRKNHMVSCFLLGFTVWRFLGANTARKWKPKFSYYWFLSCLYHDLGYVYEEASGLTFDDVSNIDKMEIPSSLKKIFDIDTIKSYYEAIASGGTGREPKRDHGIVGGCKLYSALINNYKTKKEEYRSNKGISYFNNFDRDFCVEERGRKLKFSRNADKYYKEVSLAVMLHNIWLCNNEPDGCMRYKDCKLEKLIDKKLTFHSDASLYFILLITDTIEPIKKIKKSLVDLDSIIEQVLENIFVELDNKILRISYNDGLNDYFELDQWIKDFNVLNTLFSNIEVRESSNVFEIKLVK